MLLYDNASDQRRVIILATSDDLNSLAESSSWCLDGTLKSSPQLCYQILILHAELPCLTDDRSWCLPTVYILLTHKDETVTSNPVTGSKEHSLFHTWVRRLMRLAMVPDAFANISDSIPHTLDLDSFLGYFEMTWVSEVTI